MCYLAAEGWLRAGLAVVALIVAQPALAEDWWVVYAGENPLELELMLVDDASVKRVAGEANAVSFHETAVLEGFNVSTEKVIRCDTQQSRALTTAAFLSDGKPSPVRMQVVPGWAGLASEGQKAVYRFVCPPRSRDEPLMQRLGKGLDRMNVVRGLEQGYARALPEIRRILAEKEDKARMNHYMGELDVLLGNPPEVPAKQQPGTP